LKFYTWMFIEFYVEVHVKCELDDHVLISPGRISAESRYTRRYSFHNILLFISFEFKSFISEEMAYERGKQWMKWSKIVNNNGKHPQSMFQYLDRELGLN
jgi:hypothetical protein